MEAADRAADFIELIRRAQEPFKFASRCRRMLRLTQVKHLCCSAVSDSPVLPNSTPASMGLLDSRLLPRFGLLGSFSHLPAYIILDIAHVHAFLFAPHLVALFLFFLAVPPAVVGRSFNGRYPRWVKLPYNLPTMTLPTSFDAFKVVGRGFPPAIHSFHSFLVQ